MYRISIAEVSEIWVDDAIDFLVIPLVGTGESVGDEWGGGKSSGKIISEVRFVKECNGRDG